MRLRIQSPGKQVIFHSGRALVLSRHRTCRIPFRRGPTLHCFRFISHRAPSLINREPLIAPSVQNNPYMTASLRTFQEQVRRDRRARADTATAFSAPMQPARRYGPRWRAARAASLLSVRVIPSRLRISSEFFQVASESFYVCLHTHTHTHTHMHTRTLHIHTILHIYCSACTFCSCFTNVLFVLYECSVRALRTYFTKGRSIF
jgi:hypothetical protein